MSNLKGAAALEAWSRLVYKTLFVTYTYDTCPRHDLQRSLIFVISMKGAATLEAWSRLVNKTLFVSYTSDTCPRHNLAESNI